MFDPELVRNLCQRLLEENDPARFDELASRLHAIVSSNVDQLRLKVNFIARHYPELLLLEPSEPEPKPKPEPKNSLRLYIIR